MKTQPTCFFLVLSAAQVLALAPAGVRAVEVPAAVSPKLDTSVARGLDYLVKQQNPDGSFTAGRNADGSPNPAAGPPMATTGLALLAFLSAGHAPDLGRHGLVVRNSVDFLVRKVPAEDGYVGAANGDRGDDSRMYGQGIVTLALAQAYGLEGDGERRRVLHVTLKKMLAVILAAQAVAKPAAHAGGWRHAPDAPDSDLSVTGWCALALRACRDLGLDVPQDAFDRAARYVLTCRNPLDRGFAYQPGGPGQAGTTGIALSTLHALGAAAPGPEVAEAQKFLAQAGAQPPARFPYYTMYHALQAALRSGPPAWGAVSKPILDTLLAAQSPDGGWPPSVTPEEPGRAYATAMAVLTLTAPQRVLPVYQRGG